MIKAFVLAVGQIGDRAVLNVLMKTLVLTLAVFIGMGALLYVLGQWAVAAMGWNLSANAALGAFSALAVLFAAFLWFRIVALAVLQLFGDDIVIAVERKHYPAAADTARPATMVQNLSMGLRSFGRALLFNLIALPAYVTLLFTGVGLPVAFLVVNALLLGRDLQDMVVARHTTKASDGIWNLGSVRRFGLGLVTAALFLVPFVNLFAPIIGAAMATHLVHRKVARHKQAAAPATVQGPDI